MHVEGDLKLRKVWASQLAQCAHPTWPTLQKELSPLISGHSVNTIYPRVRWPNSQNNGFSSCPNQLYWCPVRTGSALLLSVKSGWRLHFPEWLHLEEGSNFLKSVTFWISLQTAPSLCQWLCHNLYPTPGSEWREPQGSENCPWTSEGRASHRTRSYSWPLEYCMYDFISCHRELNKIIQCIGRACPLLLLGKAKPTAVSRGLCTQYLCDCPRNSRLLPTNTKCLRKACLFFSFL